MTLRDLFRRWRARRGYGVHSPLAYRLVRHVVRPERGVAYYGEERLADELTGATPQEVGRARLLLRFVAEMQPSAVWVSPGMPERLLEAIRLAGCVVRVFDGALFPERMLEADMIVIWRKWIAKRELRRALRPGCSLIAFEMKANFARVLADCLPGGVMLAGRDAVMAVATADPALHSYDI